MCSSDLDLRERHDDELQVAGGADPGDGVTAELRDEVQVDQIVQRLEEHAREDGDGHAPDVAGDGALGEVVQVYRVVWKVRESWPRGAGSTSHTSLCYRRVTGAYGRTGLTRLKDTTRLKWGSGPNHNSSPTWRFVARR